MYKYSLATGMLINTCIDLWLFFEECMVQLGQFKA